MRNIWFTDFAGIKRHNFYKRVEEPSNWTRRKNFNDVITNKYNFQAFLCLKLLQYGVTETLFLRPNLCNKVKLFLYSLGKPRKEQKNLFIVIETAVTYFSVILIHYTFDNSQLMLRSKEQFEKLDSSKFFWISEKVISVRFTCLFCVLYRA